MKDTPSQQNHAAVYAKIFFNWAISEGCLETNPLQHYKQGKKVRRKRILTDDELRAVWSAAGEIGGIFFGVIVRLIMLTGQRRGEIAALLESYYSHNQQTVTLPGELTKNHLEHTFPAGTMAVGLITAQIAADRRESKFLFPSRTSIERPFNGWSKCKKELDKVANIEPWTLHDLRRTFRTNLGRLKVNPDIAERLVNHISARTEMEETYDLYTYLPEMREAMERWETFCANRLHRRSGITRGLITAN